MSHIGFSIVFSFSITDKTSLFFLLPLRSTLLSAFSQLAPQLPKDASIGVMFCCMLYLANEKNLTLDGNDDLDDIRIVRQDDAEHDEKMGGPGH